MLLTQIRQRAVADAPALIYPQRQGQFTTVTYRQLLERAEVLAVRLHHAGLRPGQLAGIFMRRCPEHVIAMLAILRCGAAFFSLNPKLSHHQVTHALTISQAPLLLIDHAALVRLNQGETWPNVQLLHYSEEKWTAVQEKLCAQIAALRLDVLTNAALPDVAWPVIAPQDVALALFTSGTTGNPKGVLISHQDLLNGQLRYLTISGGDLSPGELDKLYQWSRPAGIYKTYGQSESFRSAMLLPDEFVDKSRSVGRPPPNVEVLIIDEQGNRLPANQEGQVLHRGLGTMLGYLGDPTGTQDKLRPNPCQTTPAVYAQTVVYTGDMGKVDEQGFLYLLGRRDGMLKIQGNRVYPKEIQNALLEHPQVAEAAVVGIETAQGWQLCAQARLIPESCLTQENLLQFLQRNLPGYMVPAHVMLVTEFVHTASGKIALGAVEQACKAAMNA